MRNKSERQFNLFGYIIITILAINALIPVILLIMSSITDNDALILYGYNFIPSKISFEAYKYIFTTSDAVIRAYGVSIILTATGVTCSLTITTMLGYAIARQGLPGRGYITFIVFFTMLFNGGLVPSYVNYTTIFHIKDTFFALLIPNLLMGALNVLLVKSYFVAGVPGEILEAAYIDGATEMQTFSKVALPLAKPIVATIALFTGLAYWNDWNNGYVYLARRTNLFSIQNLLNRMIQNIQYLTQNAGNIVNSQQGLASIPSIAVRMAIAIVGLLPVLIAYPFVQKYFVRGITLGGVKG